MSGISKAHANGSYNLYEQKEPAKKLSSRNQDFTRFGNSLNFPSNVHRPLAPSAAKRVAAKANSNPKVSSVANPILNLNSSIKSQNLPKSNKTPSNIRAPKPDSKQASSGSQNSTEGEQSPIGDSHSSQLEPQLSEAGEKLGTEISSMVQAGCSTKTSHQNQEETDWETEQGNSMQALIQNELNGTQFLSPEVSFEEQDEETLVKEAEELLYQERQKAQFEAQVLAEQRVQETLKMHEKIQMEMAAKHKQEMQEQIERAEREYQEREKQLAAETETQTKQKFEETQRTHEESLRRIQQELAEKHEKEIKARLEEVQREQEERIRMLAVQKQEEANRIILDRLGQIPNKTQELMFFPAQFDPRLPTHLTLNQFLDTTTSELRNDIFSKYSAELDLEGFKFEVSQATLLDAELILQMKRGVRSLLVEAGEWRLAFDNLLLRILPQLTKKVGLNPTEESLKGVEQAILQEIQDQYSQLLKQHRIAFMVTPNNLAIVDLMIQITINRDRILDRITKLLEKGGYFNIPKNYEDLIQYMREQTPRIDKLDLSNLKLLFLPREISLGVWRVEELNLDQNNILYFLPDSFRFMRVLKRLFIRENPLIALPADMGHHLTNLEEINCSRICPTGLPMSVVQNCDKLSDVNVGPFNIDTIRAKLNDYPKPKQGKEYPFLNEILELFTQGDIARINWNIPNSNCSLIFLQRLNGVVKESMEVDDATLRNWYENFKRVASALGTEWTKKKIDKLSVSEKETISALYTYAIARYGIRFRVGANNWMDAEKYLYTVQSLSQSMKTIEEEAVRSSVVCELRKSQYFQSLNKPFPETLDQLTNLLSEFPVLVKEIKSIQLNEKQLIRVPEYIRYLTHVTTLDLSNNQITRLPIEIMMKLENLKMLKIHNNPIEVVADELVAWLAARAQVIYSNDIVHPEIAKRFMKSNEEHRKKFVSQPQVLPN